MRQRGRELDAGAVRNAVQQALEDQHVLVVGAYHENQPGFAHGKMVGVLVMSVGLSIEHAGEAGWVKTLYVRPEYRRRGLAEKMLRQALAWSETRGLRALDLEFGEAHESEATRRLYEKHGFHPVQLTRLSHTFTHPAP
jgi:ribosomal protein S18 acetylase RimI-like enzyme